MHIRRIRPGDSRMDIGRIYEGKSKTLREEQYPYLLSDYAIRLLRSDEVYLLKDFLYEAIFIPKGMKAPPKTIVNQSELRVYTDDFGAREGDYCLVADFGGKVVGAVWTRLMNGYGHIDDETPSLAI